MKVLGISSGFHDAAAALVDTGSVVAAVEQERLSRRKHDPSFPEQAMDACLAIAGCAPSDIDVVALHERPMGVIDRHLRSRLRAGPRAAGALLLDTPGALAAQLSATSRVRRWFAERGSRLPTVHVSEHHASHAAAAYYTSPFTSAAVLTVDGVGEWATTAISHGRGRRLTVEADIAFPHSIGLLYSAFTAFCGFHANGGEGELMGLAPYGTPRYAERIREELIHIDGEGFRLDERYFSFGRGRTMTTRRFASLFDGPAHPRGAPPTEREQDLAASVQVVLAELMIQLAQRACAETGERNLCLGGGVALNCVANAAVLAEGSIDDVWVVPAPGDSGSAIGAALWSWHEVMGNERTVDEAGDGWALGPSFSDQEVHEWLQANGVAHDHLASDDAVAERTADLLASGRAVGVLAGPMEFGPRALGHRSILADPRSATIRPRLNELVKERAPFRPFAPAVLAEQAGRWFEMDRPSPYMTRTVPVRPEVDLPAVTHVDGSARVQTVTDHTPMLAAVLRAFERRTDCPVLLNTSFNGRDEPIVCTPADALATYERIGLDALVMERCVLERPA